ncbi:MAG: magnesium transporter [Paracoccaceae bacterium]|tara:strand:+ start:752 stop:2143 length:1392 start_codon:yes stop_codon:yes gene_type:complete
MLNDEQKYDSDLGSKDASYVIDKQKMAIVLSALASGNRVDLTEVLEPLHPADIADIIEQLNTTDRARFIRLYDTEFYGDILSEIDEHIREEVISELNPDVLAEAVRDLESDDVVDIVEDLEEEQKETILDALEEGDRVAVQSLLSYPEQSAGRLMQREVVMAPEHWSVGMAIDFLRNDANLPEQFYHIVLVDPRLHPVGNVSLGKLMSSKRSVLLREIIEDVFQVIPADQDEADVAYAFNQYHLISAPVVDMENRVVGVITIDDAMVVLDEELEEDIMLLAGVGDSSVSDTIIETVRGRLPWLAVNLATAILASIVIAQFEATIAQFVALAILMPIIASMGGNAATQSLTVAVRAIATKDISSTNIGRVIRREVGVGILTGLIFAVSMGLIGVFWFGTAMLGVVIAISMLINLVVANLAGTTIPVILEKLGIDPALASGAFVTTVTDVVGFFAFLSIAGILLL